MMSIGDFPDDLIKISTMKKTGLDPIDKKIYFFIMTVINFHLKEE
jgi:hypothetical protein